MFEDNPNQKTTKSVKEVFERLKAHISNGHGDDPFYVTVPFRDGMGFHYEGVVNIMAHEGVVDMAVTMPDSNDIDLETKSKIVSI